MSAYNSVAGGVAAPGRRVASPPRRKPAPARPAARTRSKKKADTLFRTVCIAAALLFCLCVGILIQHSIILSLGHDINQLQTQYDDVKSINDSKEGQLVSSRDYSQIEATARSYGMTEATAEQKVSETVTPQDKTLDISEQAGWFAGLFQ